MPDAPLPQLEYAPRPPAVPYRRWARFVIRWAVIVTCCVLIAMYGPPAVRQAFYLRAQQPCLNVSIPPDQLVYSNAPDDLKPLRAAGYVPAPRFTKDSMTGGGTNTSKDSVGLAVQALAGVDEDTIASYASNGLGFVRMPLTNAPKRAIGFLNIRRNAHVKEDRLVAVVFIERQRLTPGARPTDTPVKLEVNALVWQPATWELGSRLELRAMTTLALTPIEGKEIRIYAGQPDPKDAAHLTLPYTINGERGVIDGNLDFVDRVNLQVRNGPATSPTWPGNP